MGVVSVMLLGVTFKGVKFVDAVDSGVEKASACTFQQAISVLGLRGVMQILLVGVDSVVLLGVGVDTIGSEVVESSTVQEAASEGGLPALGLPLAGKVSFELAWPLTSFYQGA